ncbi:MAG: GGDEF domain-containing protein [Lachnospiraceae bacterium]|nr:GGDEF domain-containing protein [Lachnospiraceae bacterium]
MNTKRDDFNIAEVTESIDYESLEEKANRFTVKCLIVTYFIMVFVWIMNLLEIFIVDKDLMNYGFLLMSVLMLALIAICRLVGYRKPAIKYVIIVFAIAMTAVLGVVLTYHIIIASVLPLIYAIQYSSKKMLFITYGLNAIGIFAMVMIGYYYGLCDANMALLTTKPLKEYVDAWGMGNFGPINDNPWVTLPLYYVFPRCLVLLALIPLLIHVSQGIAKRELRELYLKRMSEIDDMTQLYNKNKYRTMIKEYYPTVEKVGVIFWDVNGLKETNDNLGHIMGDKLIAAIADSIRGFTDDTHRAYRIGGDEFIFIAENESDLRLNEIVNEWRKIIEESNKDSDIPLSAAVGYSSGPGVDIGATIKRADDFMYADKAAHKNQIAGRAPR